MVKKYFLLKDLQSTFKAFAVIQLKIFVFKLRKTNLQQNSLFCKKKFEFQNGQILQKKLCNLFEIKKGQATRETQKND